MGKVIMSGIVEPLTVPSNLPPKGNALNTYTWEQIRKVSDAGQAANYFATGDTKSITINGTVGATTFSNLSIDAFILGIDHNASLEGANRIHFQIGKIGGVDVALCDAGYNNYYTSNTSARFAMNTSTTNVGGWSSSYMRSAIMAALKNALPSELSAILKSVTKYTDNAGNASADGTISATTDYLWLLAEFEVHGARTYATTGEQSYQLQYDYYKAGNSKVKCKHDTTTTAASWWLRSPYSSYAHHFCLVKTNGSAGTDTATISWGLAPIFAV